MDNKHKVYLFFIKIKDLDKKLHYHVYGNKLSDSDDSSFLYAFTISKKKKEEFLRERKKFHLITSYMDDVKYKEFVDKYSECELDWRLYRNYKKEIKILSTKFELDHCRNGGWISMIEPEKCFSHISWRVIDAMKDEYKEALENLALNNLILVSEEDTDVTNFGMSFDDEMVLTIDTKQGKKCIECSYKLKSKEINIFIHDFKHLLRDG